MTETFRLYGVKYWHFIDYRLPVTRIFRSTLQL